MSIILLLISLAVALQLVTPGFTMAIEKEATRVPTLLISLDGFRADKLEEFLLNNPNSNFQTMMLNKGVKAEYMMPSFPSLTFPNHFTLVTGLFMENHGIVGNDLYDPNYNEYVNLIRDGKGKDIRFWNATEPIWESARKQGLKTASSFWAGSEVWLKNPDIFLPYNDEFLFESRCDEVINWFTKFELDFATLYWNEPDKTGHKYGPDSPQYMDKIAEVDKSIGYLFTKLNESNLIEKLNVIITSDHGMASMNGSMLVKDFIDLSLIDSKKSIFGIVSNIWPSSDALKEELFKALEKIPHMKVYYKENVPKDLHFTSNDRIAPIVAISEESYVLNNVIYDDPLKGNHGFDSAIKSMRTIFMARGPSFAVNRIIDPVNNVDVYPLLCELIQVQCHPHNGTLDHFAKAMNDSASNNSAQSCGIKNTLEKSVALFLFSAVLYFAKF